jgi:hypothetical protein
VASTINLFNASHLQTKHNGGWLQAGEPIQLNFTDKILLGY